MFFLFGVALVAGICTALYLLSISLVSYSGTLKVCFPSVRMSENGVLSMTAASVGWLTYWFALLIVIGRTACVNPPLIPPIANGINKRKQRVCMI